MNTPIIAHEYEQWLKRENIKTDLPPKTLRQAFTAGYEARRREEVIACDKIIEGVLFPSRRGFFSNLFKKGSK